MALRPTLTDGLPLSWNSETTLDGEWGKLSKGRPENILDMTIENVDYAAGLSNRGNTFLLKDPTLRRCAPLAHAWCIPAMHRVHRMEASRSG
jgi:hypothetical protein